MWLPLLPPPFGCCRLAVAGTIASSAAYVTAKLAEAVGHASYVTALAIAKSLPGHKKRHQGETQVGWCMAQNPLVSQLSVLQPQECVSSSAATVVRLG